MVRIQCQGICRIVMVIRIGESGFAIMKAASAERNLDLLMPWDLFVSARLRLTYNLGMGMGHV
jgi:hypothetical protein